MTNGDATFRLITIGPSHYCEKARWALTHAGVPFVEAVHAPIFHLLRTVPLGGRTVPLLVGAGKVLRDSTEILKYADSHARPGRRLYPNDAAARRDVEELEDLFDETLGPATRRLAYHHLLQSVRSFHEIMRAGLPPAEERVFTAIHGLALRIIAKRYRVTDAACERSRGRIESVLDTVEARLADGRRFLGGDTFSAADLTFASLLGVVQLPPEYGMPAKWENLEPSPDQRAFAARISERRAGAFASRIYREERRRFSPN
jgi:glutathione S-transferase